MTSGVGAAGRGPDRRELGLAVLLCLVGAFLVLVGAGREWAAVDVPAGPVSPARTVAVTGADVAGGVRALGLVGLAGVVALAATRRSGRVVVGVLLLLAGAGVAVAALGADAAGALADEAPDAAGARTSLWPLVTALGGALLAAAGGLTAVRGRGWPALGQRYEAPAGRGAAPLATPAQQERALWEALDRGEDPTAR